MVKVPTSLSSQLRQIEDSAEVDMQDIGAVLAYTRQHGLREAWRTTLFSYLLCINEGMEGSH